LVADVRRERATLEGTGWPHKPVFAIVKPFFYFIFTMFIPLYSPCCSCSFTCYAWHPSFLHFRHNHFPGFFLSSHFQSTLQHHSYFLRTYFLLFAPQFISFKPNPPPVYQTNCRSIRSFACPIRLTEKSRLSEPDFGVLVLPDRDQSFQVLLPFLPDLNVVLHSLPFPLVPICLSFVRGGH